MVMRGPLKIISFPESQINPGLKVTPFLSDCDILSSFEACLSFITCFLWVGDLADGGRGSCFKGGAENDVVKQKSVKCTYNYKANERNDRKEE